MKGLIYGLGAAALLVLGVGSAAARERSFTEEEKAWWAIRSLADPDVPATNSERVRNPIDAFVLRKLGESGLDLAHEARPRELIRRLYFDLHGLPPAPEKVEAFVTAFSKGEDAAYLALVDELLASPRYGERWATHWLDVVRYADSDGYRADGFRPTAYLYRDYVIRSLNEDKPYDRFVREQLAGDELAPEDPDVLIATAFLRHGIYEWNQRDARMQWSLIMNEMTNVTGEVFLGVGIGCAQCHDHKFDPLLQKDYYSLQSFLSSVWWPENRKLGNPEQMAALGTWEEETRDLRERLAVLEDEALTGKDHHSLKQFPQDVQAVYRKPAAERTAYEEQLAQLVERQVQVQRRRQKVVDLLKNKPDKQAAYQKLKAELTELEKKKPKLLDAFVAVDVGPRPARTFLPSRSEKTEVEPAFLTLLGHPAPEIQPTASSTGRRTALADWIASPDNPLSTRVIVNRVWQRHFGTGIVSTPNDFGTLGEPPSHPELLDWLTRRFLQDGWHLKPLHKLILTSSTYRQTARREPSKQILLTDPGNLLLWRFPSRRLSAEQVRDAMLAVSGELRAKNGGPSVGSSSLDRSVYLKKMRNSPDPVLKTFDAPAGFDSAPSRLQTTTPTQALLLSNNDWPLKRAKAFAAKLLRQSKSIGPELVNAAYLAAYARPPEAEERDAALAYLRSLTADPPPKLGPVAKPDKFPDENGLRPLAQAFGKVSMPEPFGLGPYALWLQPGSRFEQLEWKDPDDALGDAFTIEAVASLDSIHADASVNALASRWNGNHRSSGWTFVVTSAKSRYSPRNFVLQIIGENVGGDVVYEVVPSNLRVPTGKPVYLAASIATSSDGNSSATFHLLDLSDPAAELQTAKVDFNVASRIQSASTKFLVGGRDQRGHLWDGQLARLVLSPGALPVERLLLSHPANPPARLLDWSFRSPDGERPAPSTSWLRRAAPKPVPSSPSLAAVTDFCHALLNSNEFLYLH